VEIERSIIAENLSETGTRVIAWAACFQKRKAGFDSQSVAEFGRDGSRVRIPVIVHPW
jgi:hypothetical protein